MRRYRWYRAEWPLSMRELSRRLQECPFRMDGHEGFLVDRVRSDYVEARFIQKREYIDEINNPLGEVIRQTRLEFIEHSFRAGCVGPGLELSDPPRSVNRLFSKLAEICDFSLVLSNIDIEPLDWVSLFRKESRLETITESLQFSKVVVDRDVYANIVIKSNRDVYKQSTDFLAGRKARTEKVKVSFNKAGYNHVFFTRNGAMAVKNNDEEVVEAARHAISNL
jgi:hypothetical protein